MGKKNDRKPGYKNPPIHGQFQKGKSGNPKGRPKKKPPNFAELVYKELLEEITVVENGNKRKISKQHAIAKKLINEALTGNPASLKLLQTYLDKVPVSQTPRIFLVCDRDREEENRRKVEENMKKRNAEIKEEN